MIFLLKQVQLKIEKPDSWWWLLDGNFEYLVQFMSKKVDKVSANNKGDPMKWCQVIPRKIDLFDCRVTRCFLLVMTLLQHYTAPYISLQIFARYICSNVAEMINNAILRCPPTNNIWSAVFGWCDLDVSLLSEMTDLLHGGYIGQAP